MSISRRPALIAACLALAAGGAGAAVLVSSAGASTVNGTGTGTATISVTRPAGTTHTSTRDVSCKLTDGRYVVRSIATHGHRSSRLRLTVRDDTGAGSYTGTAVIARRSRSGFSRHHYKVRVTLTTDGGSINDSTTLSGKRDPALKGKTISADARWTCSV